MQHEKSESSQFFIKVIGLTLLLVAFVTLGACRDLSNDNSRQSTLAPAGSPGAKPTGTDLPGEGGAAAADGGDVSGGGAGYESEFSAVMDQLIVRMENVGMYRLPLPDDLKEEMTLDVFKELIAPGKIKVSFVTKELSKEIDGVTKTVDALNSPDTDLIEVNIPRWVAMKKAEAREDLVMHEVFGVLEIEKDVYDKSRAVLETLRKIEHPKKPEEECPVETMGNHDGDACLLPLQHVATDSILALQETLLTFAEADSQDDETLAAAKVKIKTHVEGQRDNFDGERDQNCQGASLSKGNPAAYDESICVIEFTRQRLKTMIEFFNKVKKQYPTIPYPRAPEPWSG